MESRGGCSSSQAVCWADLLSEQVSVEQIKSRRGGKPEALSSWPRLTRADLLLCNVLSAFKMTSSGRDKPDKRFPVDVTCRNPALVAQRRGLAELLQLGQVPALQRLAQVNNIL